MQVCTTNQNKNQTVKLVVQTTNVELKRNGKLTAVWFCDLTDFRIFSRLKKLLHTVDCPTVEIPQDFPLLPFLVSSSCIPFQSSKAQPPKKTLQPSILELKDFYMTDAISRASQTMAKCVNAVKTMK